jgi:hypothetical protein
MIAIARVCFCLLLLACADTARPLCDGSDDIRLALFDGGGGPLPESYAFIHPSDHARLLINGQCQFHVEGDHLDGIRTGKLSTSEAEQLAHDVMWDELATWSYDWHQDQSCPDAGYATIAGAQGFGSCSCGCDANAPSGLDGALLKAYEWAARLASEGQALAGPVSALALDSTEQSKVLTEVKGASLSFEDWPLDREMSAIDGLIHSRSEEALLNGNATYALFSAMADYTKLREMRNAHDPNASDRRAGIPVKEGSSTYDVFIRDELPDAVAQSWATRRSTLPKP